MTMITAMPARTGRELEVLPPSVWVDPRLTPAEITHDIPRPLAGHPGLGWWICLALAFALLINVVCMVTYLIAKGIGIWGESNNVDWAFDITNFVFWIGIGHAGTLISAILLLLFRQERRSRSRTGASAPAIAPTTAPTRCGDLTGTTTPKTPSTTSI